MFIHGRLILTSSGILLDEVKSLLQKALRRKEFDLAVKATQELIGRGKDQLPWKCIVTYMFEDHCLNGEKILERLVGLHKMKDKRSAIELILRHCGTCRIAAYLPVIATDKEYAPVDWRCDIMVEEDLQNLVLNDKSQIDCDLLLQHLKTAWLEKHEKHLITYMEMLTMVNDHDKSIVTDKGRRYCYFTQLTKNPNIIMVALTVLSKASKEQGNTKMQKYCSYSCYLATIREAPLRLIMSAAVTQYLYSDAARNNDSIELGKINWSKVEKLKFMPEWAVDKHTFRGKTGRSTKPYLKNCSEAKHLSEQEIEEFHGERPMVDIRHFFAEGVQCKDEILPEKPFWKHCQELYLEKKKHLQKTVRMTSVYYAELLKQYCFQKQCTKKPMTLNNLKRKTLPDDDLKQFKMADTPMKKLKVDSVDKTDIHELETIDEPCLRGPLLQLPTGPAKVYTRIDLDNGSVWKGPYRNGKLSLGMFFHRVFREVLHCPHTLMVKRNGQFLRFPLLKGIKANISITVKDFYDCISKQEVKGGRFVTRESLDIIQLHKLNELQMKKVPISLWCHFMFRYILNVGDSGLFNCITDSQMSFLYGIDLEENRTGTKDNELLTLMFTKRPKKELQDVILRCLKSNKQEAVRLMTQEFDIGRIKALAKFYRIVFKEDQFKDRLSQVVHALCSQIP